MLDIATYGFDFSTPAFSTKKDSITEHPLPDELQEDFRCNADNSTRIHQALLDSLFHAHFVSHYELALINQFLILGASKIPSGCEKGSYISVPFIRL